MDLNIIKRQHKEWRKIAKKERRKRIRKQKAVERDQWVKKEKEIQMCDPNYQARLLEQRSIHDNQRKADEIEQQEAEELWLRRELLAQQEFRKRENYRQAAEAKTELKRLEIQKEFENRKKADQERIDERKRLEEMEREKYEMRMKKIQEYIEIGGEIPEELKELSETNPGKEICPFFSRTNGCRYGTACSKNHIRPHISRILLFRHFFTHIRIEQNKNREFGPDFGIEFDENEILEEYKSFFEDIVTEFEKFGTIQNVRTCCNFEPHLRGNVYVEYTNERDALKAFMKLQGRYYASKQINIEFSSIASWKNAICGMSYNNKCTKGRNCNYLHLFKNPGNKYNKSVKTRESSARNGYTIQSVQQNGENNSSWNDLNENHSRKENWRWSESPEREYVAKKANNVKSPPRSNLKHKKTKQRSNSRESSRDRNYSKRRKSRSQSRSRYQSKDPIRSSNSDKRRSYHSHRSKSRSRTRQRSSSLSRKSIEKNKSRHSDSNKSRSSSKYESPNRRKAKDKSKERKSKKKKKNKDKD